MQKQSRDWLIAAITLGVGITATVVVPPGKVGSALLGSTTGAVIGATVLNKRQGESRLRQLEAQVLNEDEWQRLEAELPGLKTTVNQLRQEKTDLAEISGKLTQRQSEYRALVSAIANLTPQNQKLEQQVAVWNSKLAGVNGQLSHRQSELQLLHHQHEQARQKLETLFQQQGVAQEHLHVPQAELVSINAQLNAMSPEVERLRQAYATLTQQNQDKEQQVAAKNSELAGVNGQLIHRQSELELLNRQHEQARQEREVLAQQQHLASERLSTLQAELAFINAQLSALNPEVERLEEQKRSLVNVKAQLAVRQAEFTQLEPRVQALEKRAQELAQQSAELELLRATYDGLFSERQSLENRINSLNPEIARLEAERRQIEQAIENQADKYANSVQLRQEINELKHTIVRLRRQQNEQEAENNHLKDESAHLTQTLRELQEQIKNVESKLGDTNRRVETALEALKQSPWRESKLLSRWSASLDEQTFINNFITYIKDRGFNFPERVIRAFHTSLKVQDISAIVVLAGISGTGKSELPQLYAKYVGALPLVLAVQPRWDSPQDLLGFYNYMEDKFKPTPLIQGIYQYNHSPSLREQDRMVIVLLDEMNLARVEYYFSEFLSKLEARRNNDAYLDIDLGSLPLTDGERHYRIPEQFLFVGTMNEDETTQTLSDKVLDRANVLTFGKPEQLVLGSQGSNPISNSGYLTYSQFTTWIESPNPTSPVVQKVSEVLNKANKVMEALGHPFAHRVYQAITQYVVNYPGVEDEKSSAFSAALADQFGQKLLPKLRGIMTDDEHVKTNLKQLEEIIALVGDEALTKAFARAFDRACLGYQFQWKGFVYQGSQTDGQ